MYGPNCGRPGTSLSIKAVELISITNGESLQAFMQEMRNAKSYFSKINLTVKKNDLEEKEANNPQNRQEMALPLGNRRLYIHNCNLPQ